MSSPVVTTIKHLDYSILKRAAHPTRAEAYPWLFKLTTLAYWLLRCLYILCELWLIAAVQNRCPCLLWQAWVLVLTEICLTSQEAIFAFNLLSSLFCASDLTPRPILELIGAQAPTVDVLMPCCREPVDVVLDTASAAAAQDYPAPCYRVLVLDDGRDDVLEAAIHNLGCLSKARNGPEILYLSRKVKTGEKSYFKAGNLQFGIQETRAPSIYPRTELSGAQFLASLDADMIPDPRWLSRMVPHLLLDPKAAIISPPQYYYNVPSSDPFGNTAEFRMWFDLFELLNDHLGAAICNGSGFVFRREAVDSIGGWPQVEAGEDLMCSSLLNHAGWKVLYSLDGLQQGLAPGSLRAHVKQRVRWADSGLEVHKRFGFYLPGSELSRGMSVGQRAVAMTMMFREYIPLVNILALVLFPLALCPWRVGDMAMSLERREIHRVQLLFVTMWIAGKVNNAVLYADVGVQGVLNFQSNEIWCIPCQYISSAPRFSAHINDCSRYLDTAARCLISLLPPSLASMSFEASGSVLSNMNERSRSRRAPLVRRMLSMDMLLYLAYTIYALVPLAMRLVDFRHCKPGGDGVCLLILLPGILIKITDAVWKATVPLRYMLWPPTVPERRRLMAQDEKGLWRPSRVVAGLGGPKWQRLATSTDAWEVLIICMCLRCAGPASAELIA